MLVAASAQAAALDWAETKGERHPTYWCAYHPTWLGGRRKAISGEWSTASRHRLLERAYFLRARQLVQLGMRESAAEVAGHLLEFGVTGSEGLEELVEETPARS